MLYAEFTESTQTRSGGRRTQSGEKRRKQSGQGPHSQEWLSHAPMVE